MRVYAEELPRHLLKWARVTLNGERLRDVIFADEDSGVVDQYERDSSGRYVAHGDRYAIVRRQGVVRIEFTR